LNWLVRAIREESTDPASIIFGLIQTALYVDFAWVYWTRQRVKLRGGAVVDSDDLSKGWLVKRLIGQRRGEEHDDVESESANFNDHSHNGSATDRPRPKTTNSWGPRGISVSADDGVHEVEAQRQDREQLADPSRFKDEDSDDPDAALPRHADAVAITPSYGDYASDDGAREDPTLPHHRASDAETGIEGLGDGSEWREAR